jgi:hypothetical protein
VFLGTVVLGHIIYMKLGQGSFSALSQSQALFTGISSAASEVAKAAVAPSGSIPPACSPVLAKASVALQHLLGPPDSFQRSNQALFGLSIGVLGISSLSIAFRVTMKVYELLGKQRPSFPFRKLQKAFLYSTGFLMIYDAAECFSSRAPLHTFAVLAVANCLVASPSLWWSNNLKVGAALLISLGGLLTGTLTQISFILPVEPVEPSATPATPASPFHPSKALSQLLAATAGVIVLHGIEKLTEVYWITPAVFGAWNNVVKPAVLAIDMVATKAASGSWNLFKTAAKCAYNNVVKPSFSILLYVFRHACSALQTMYGGVLYVFRHACSALQIIYRAIDEYFFCTVKSTTTFLASKAQHLANFFGRKALACCKFILNKLLQPTQRAVVHVARRSWEECCTMVYLILRHVKNVLVKVYTCILRALEVARDYVVVPTVNLIATISKWLLSGSRRAGNRIVNSIKSFSIWVHANIITPIWANMKRAGNWSVSSIKSFGIWVHTNIITPIWANIIIPALKAIDYSARLMCGKLYAAARWLCIKLCLAMRRFVDIIIVPFWTPAIALISGYEFARHGLARLESSDSDLVSCLPFAFAAFVTASVGIVIVGRRFRTRAESLRNQGGAFSRAIAKVLDASALILETLGVFAYSHADLGILDLLAVVFKSVAPVIVRASRLLFSAIQTILYEGYTFCAAFVSSATSAIWEVSKKLARGFKRAFKVFYKNLYSVISLIWKNPFIGFFTACGVLYFSYHVHLNYPEFSFRAYFVDLATQVVAFAEQKSSWGSQIVKDAAKIPLSFIYPAWNYIVEQVEQLYSSEVCRSALRSGYEVAISMKLNAWRWFESRTFATVNVLVHITLSRSLRYTWAYARGGRDPRAAAVAQFGKAGVKTFILPLVILSAVSRGGGDWIIRKVEWISAPFVYGLLAYLLWKMARMTGEWRSTESELRQAQQRSAQQRIARTRAAGASGQEARRASTVASLDTLEKYKEDGGIAHIVRSETCVACMEGDGAKFTLLVCGHGPLCPDCLSQWVEVKKRNASCPSCRQNMYTAMR